MDDRKPREELITDILFALSRGGRTIRQVEWNHNSLVALNYNELIRLWIETAPMRLNLNDSTDFLEEGISNAERHARISLFAWSLPSDRRANIIIDLIEKLLIEHELSTSSSELAESWKGALFSLNELTLGLRKKEREKRSIGGRRARPTDAAKQEANALWGEAKRKGWTAPRFHAELTNKGYAIPFDTARKWLTSLRKTGSC